VELPAQENREVGDALGVLAGVRIAQRDCRGQLFNREKKQLMLYGLGLFPLADVSAGAT